ncbi:MAG: LptA/OstA family protein [Verrucomicrobiae bacterium]|nr:LptA/OstA family protein [Verrucomicrobiae bacterium]
MKTTTSLLALILFLSLHPLRAQTTEAPPAGKNPTVITSDKLRVDTEKRIGIFTGNVRVKDSRFDMDSDDMTVYFSQNQKGVEQIVAKGNVVLTQKDEKSGTPGVARGDQAVYTTKPGIGAEIVLTGNPTLTQGQNIISGKVIRFLRDQNRLVVEQGAKLILYESGDPKK